MKMKVMLMKDRITRLFLTALFLSLLSSPALAQSGQGAQPQSSQVAISEKTGQDAVCEGAAEIIPSGQQTFARKRYLAAHPKPKTKTVKPRTRK
jgi:hypothetical protein